MIGKVKLGSDVLGACWAHALTTETEEVMGLYLGAIEGDVAVVRSLIPIRRTTKEKDRVEIDPVDMAKASEKAEAVGLRIVGWYHSHPHITVHPSHVDLATQYNYQSHLDTHFFGLIFSVFNYDTKLEQDIREVIAFRTNRTEEGNICEYLEIETTLPQEEGIPSKLDVASSVVKISRILMEEEMEEYSRHTAGGDLESFTNGAVLLARLGTQAELVGGAGLEAMEELLKNYKERIKSLQARKDELKRLLAEEDD